MLYCRTHQNENSVHRLKTAACPRSGHREIYSKKLREVDEKKRGVFSQRPCAGNAWNCCCRSLLDSSMHAGKMPSFCPSLFLDYDTFTSETNPKRMNGSLSQVNLVSRWHRNVCMNVYPSNIQQKTTSSIPAQLCLRFSCSIGPRLSVADVARLCDVDQSQLVVRRAPTTARGRYEGDVSLKSTRFVSSGPDSRENF